MKNIHKTLTDEIFRNCKYIYYLENYLNTDNIKKTHPKQYSIMLDVFQTLILLKNILVADSDRTIADKITDLEITMEKCLYGELDNDSEKYKYSTRDIKGLTDKHTRYLYNKFIGWYEYLSNIGKLDNVEQEILEEINRLENVNFDEVVKGNLTHKKDKNSDYKIYLCKFNRICYDKKFKEQYKVNFEKYYGNLSNDEYYILQSLFDLVANANNGITNKIFNRPYRKLTDDDTCASIYKLYLATLNISVSSRIIERNSVFHTCCCQEIFEYFEKDTNISYDDIANNFDLHNFLYNLKANQSTWKEAKKDITKTILNELNLVYDLYNKNEYEKALEITHNIIERNKDLFIRIS